MLCSRSIARLPAPNFISHIGFFRRCGLRCCACATDALALHDAAKATGPTRSEIELLLGDAGIGARAASNVYFLLAASGSIPSKIAVYLRIKSGSAGTTDQRSPLLNLSSHVRATCQKQVSVSVGRIFNDSFQQSL